MDPHRNIFYYYRGQTPNKKDCLYDTQIEDNTTKALINLLEIFSKLNNNILFEELIKELNINFSDPIDFKLQVSGDNSRPDAQIICATKSIYIESKVMADLEEDQIKRHLGMLKENDILLIITNKNEDEKLIENLNSRIKFITWAKIYKIFSVILQNINIKELRIFIQQFLEYLEIINVIDFYGFNKNDFELVKKLRNNTIYYDEKYILRTKMNLLFEKIKEMNKQNCKLTHYVLSGVGNQQKHKDSRVWLAIKRDDFEPKINSKTKKESYPSMVQCNFTIELDINSLDINAIIRNGHAENKTSPIGIFYSKLNEYKDFFNKCDLDLWVYKRIPINGQKIMPGNEKWIEPKLLKLNTDEDLIKLKKYLISIYEKGRQFPGISIRKSINFNDSRLKDSEKLLELIKNTELELKPFLDLIHKKLIINP